jgi:hypothetical protein
MAAHDRRYRCATIGHFFPDKSSEIRGILNENAVKTWPLKLKPRRSQHAGGGSSSKDNAEC